MLFGEVIECLEENPKAKARRAGWEKNNGAFIRLQDGLFTWQSDHHSEQHYTPSHPELLASDWEVFKDDKAAA
jgi:hypothetical protein